MPNTIVLKSEGWIRKEGPAAAAITPGHLVEENAGAVRVHAGAAATGNITVQVALENDIISDGTAGTKAIDTAYATGENVLYQVFKSGDVFYGFLDSGENVAALALLESAGNGNLQEATTGTAIGRAVEAVNATSATTRIKVEVV